MGKNGTPPILKKLPTELHETYLKVGFQPQYFHSNLDEFAVISESDRQLRAVRT